MEGKEGELGARSSEDGFAEREALLEAYAGGFCWASEVARLFTFYRS